MLNNLSTISAPLKSKIIPKKGVVLMSPLPHQGIAINKWRDSVKNGKNKGALIMATATGKTNIAIWCIKDYLKHYGLKNVLFVSHLEQIWTQTEVMFKSLLPEVSCGFYVGDKKDGINTCVTIAGVSTLHNTIKNNNIPFSKNHFDFIVIDEFHHTTTPTYQTVLNYFKPNILLGMSCLKERHDNEEFLHYFGDNIIYEMDTVTAIIEGAIAGLKYYGVRDNTDYNIHKKGFKYTEFDQNRLLLLPEKDKRVIGKWFEVANGKKTIVFSPTIKHANRMAECFNERGIPAVAIHHHCCGGVETTPKIMEERTIGFKNGKYLVACTIDRWLEGADFPDAEVALLMRPTRSWRVFVQSRGRVLRPYNGKKFGIVIDAVGNHKWVKIYRQLIKEHIIYDAYRIKLADPKTKVRINGKKVVIEDITDSFMDTLSNEKFGGLYEEVKKKFSEIYTPGRSDGGHNKYQKNPIEYNYADFDLDIKEIKDILFKTREVNLTKDHLMQDYRDLKKKLGRQPTTAEYTKECHSIGTAIKLFGSWNKFLLAVGRTLIYEVNLAKEHLIQDYRDLKKKLGRQPTFVEYKKECHSFSAVKRLFGSWNKFLLAVGGIIMQERNLTKEHLIQDYRGLKKKLGRQPTATEYVNECHDIGTAIKLFGSWNKFLLAVGGTLNIEHGLTKEHLIQDYHGIKKKLGRQPTATEYVKECHGHGVIAKLFGSWNKFLLAVGGIIMHEKNLTKEHLIQDYYALKKKLRRQPSAEEYVKECHSTYIARKLFGSWNEFLLAVGGIPIIERNLTKDHLIQDYKDLKKKLGRQPTSKEYKKECHVYVGDGLFDSWKEFLSKAEGNKKKR